MRNIEKVDRAGMGVALRTLVIGAFILVVFLAGFWAMLRMAGGPDTGQTDNTAPPGEEAATTADPVLPDTTEDSGAPAVEGNPDQDPAR